MIEGQAEARVTAEPVEVVHVGEREYILVGTAHVSNESTELVRRVIDRERPDCVCVELDAQRYRALTDEKRWESLDLKEVLRNKQLSTLLVNLLLSAYQKRLGMKLGVLPGTELLEAVRAAEERGIPAVLCDRDVRVTLRRAWRSTGFFKKTLLLSAVLESLLFGREAEVTEDQIQNLLQKDVLSEMMNELGKAMPSLKTVLIDERDAFITQKMKDVQAQRIVAVVGAGHLAGIKEALLEGRNVDLEQINAVPAVSRIWKWLGWGIPAAIVGAVAYIGWAKGSAAAGSNILYWILVNGVSSALGAVAALAHPLTILTAFVAAPITSLTPVIGAGYVTALVQAYVRPPIVQEFQTVAEDVFSLRRWWESRLLRIFLAFLLPGFGSMVGSWLGAVEIFRNAIG